MCNINLVFSGYKMLRAWFLYFVGQNGSQVSLPFHTTASQLIAAISLPYTVFANQVQLFFSTNSLNEPDKNSIMLPKNPLWKSFYN